MAQMPSNSGDLGDLLMELAKTEEDNRKERELKREIKSLKQTLEDLSAREKRLLASINAGSVQPLQGYQPVETAAAKRARTDKSDENLLEIFTDKMKLKALALATGFVVEQKQNGHLLAVTMFPSHRGNQHGPYRMTLRQRSCGEGAAEADEVGCRPRLRRRAAEAKDETEAIVVDHNLPFGVGVKALEEEHIAAAAAAASNETDETEPSLEAFVTSVWQRLQALISRKCQIEELKEKFQDEPYFSSNLRFSDDYLKLKFSLTMHDVAESETDEDRDDDGELIVRVALSYAPTGARPLPGSLKVRFRGEAELDPEDADQLLQQCEAFYESTLVDAVQAAFQG